MHLRHVALLLALAACASEPGPEAARNDSAQAAAIVAPRHDTLMQSVNMRCANGTEVRANVFVGSDPRVVIATHDTGFSLPPRDTVAGRRYANDDGSIIWLMSGDSARLTFRGTTTTCGSAADVIF